MISKKAHLTEVYVWQLPVRIFHWVNALCIVILCITGYIIGNPPAIMHATPPVDNYWVRLGTPHSFHSRIHFYLQLLGAYLLVFRR